jgi:hypothetical protein
MVLLDKAIFAYGYNAGQLSMSNLVSNTGVVGSDVTGVGTARYTLAASSYGGDKAIFGYGGDGYFSITNLVSILEWLQVMLQELEQQELI